LKIKEESISCLIVVLEPFCFLICQQTVSSYQSETLVVCVKFVWLLSGIARTLENRLIRPSYVDLAPKLGELTLLGRPLPKMAKMRANLQSWSVI